MTKKMIQIATPVIGEAELQAIQEPLKRGWLTQGPMVAEFEAMFCAAHQVKHAIAVTSCTTGLHLALLALGIGPGDEVIIPAFTWVASANAVLYCGATPVFIDIDKQTYNIDTQQLKQKITVRTKAIMAVHLFGLCADIDAIKTIAPEIPIIEDAACAAGAKYKNKMAGNLGDIAVFSFHPRKIITTGEGGMITTNNDKHAELINQLRNHGASISEEQRHQGPKPYLLPEFNLLGFNYRMTDLQAAVGLVQLPQLEKFNQQRQQFAKYYQEQLAQIEWLQLPKQPDNYHHGWQAFVCYVDEKTAPCARNEMMQQLQDNGVSTRPGTHAVHMLKYYQDKYKLSAEDFSTARDCNNQTMAIPLHNAMTENDVDTVIHALKQLG